MFTETMFVTLAISLDRAKKDGNTSWKNINKHFNARAFDRRYKVYFGACHNNLSGFWFVGNPDKNGRKCLVEFIGDNIYVRPVYESDKYQKKPCYKISRLDDDGYISEWQNEYLI